ncbi:MAG: UDP-galactopyranose mutase [Bacteroidales bacterium]|jgi:UDP-galactopyranose mutase|nr:UDP-galactopyranose mutase [Bacteroidales bacterium]
METQKHDAVVVGAGFAGAVFARCLAETGKKILVIEKRTAVGGNMADKYVENILVHTYGPHIFHTNMPKVFDFLKRFSQWFKYEHRVMGKIEGKLVPIPFNFTAIDTLFDCAEADKLKAKLSRVFGENKTISIFGLLNHHDEELKHFGKYVYEKVFAGYTAKQWGVSIDKIEPSTINRVPVVTGYDDRYFSDFIQMMPLEGYTKLFNNLVDHKNISVLLNTNAKDKIRLDFDSRKIFFEDREYRGIVFFTGAVDELLDYKYGRLPYRSLDLVFEKHEKPEYQRASVVNYPNDEKWTRITEFKHFTSPAKDTSEKTLILKEYPSVYEPEAVREPFYPVINSESKAVYEKYAHDLSGFPCFYLCGRLAEYKYYNMDAVIERALELAEQIKIKTLFSPHLLLIKEITLYGIIGSCCAALDSVIFLLLRKAGVNLYAANFISINAGICTSFLLNTFINFKVKDKLKIRGVKFFAVGYTGLLLSMLVMHIGVKALGAKEMIVKIVSVFIVAAVQFTLNKLFTFKKETV